MIIDPIPHLILKNNIKFTDEVLLTEIVYKCN